MRCIAAAEMRDILERAVKPAKRVRLGDAAKPKTFE